MWGTTKRDDWIKENIPTDINSEFKLALKIAMQNAYNQGFLQGEEEACAKFKARQREDRYGHDLQNCFGGVAQRECDGFIRRVCVSSTLTTATVFVFIY